ncbi:hypothetical protein [Clostridium culturomicium]|uniref:hypothetical protein n=1 Tax=Clostridium culturomicium TaxID=1499683 RepID=UPI000590ED09|nr:hypothetical protein [Clostridium culturomicium]
MKEEKVLNYIFEAIYYLDKAKGELDIIADYFEDRIKKRNSVRAFYDESTDKYVQYMNKMYEFVERVKLYMELSGDEEEFNKLLNMKKKVIDSIFVTYSEDSSEDCLINYNDLCNNQIHSMDEFRVYLKSIYNKYIVRD